MSVDLPALEALFEKTCLYMVVSKPQGYAPLNAEL